MRFLTILLLFLAFNANAWMERWAPEFKTTPAKYRKLSAQSVTNFVNAAWGDEGEESIRSQYSQGGAFDLNGDKIEDYVFVIPWIGCGLAGDGYNVYFIVSNGKGGRTESVMECFGADISDLVSISGKPFFKVSSFHGHFEKSIHNHWVYQMLSFGKDGTVKCANAEIGKPFPAVTIFYENPKFRQIELTTGDLKKIASELKPKPCKPSSKDLLQRCTR